MIGKDEAPALYASDMVAMVTNPDLATDWIERRFNAAPDCGFVHVIPPVGAPGGDSIAVTTTTVPGVITGGTYTFAPRWNFCPGCGQRLETSWAYCAGCGKAIGQAALPYYVPVPHYPKWPYPWEVPTITWGNSATAEGAD